MYASVQQSVTFSVGRWVVTNNWSADKLFATKHPYVFVGFRLSSTNRRKY